MMFWLVLVLVGLDRDISLLLSENTCKRCSRIHHAMLLKAFKDVRVSSGGGKVVRPFE
jgi:hypothetical protein